MIELWKQKQICTTLQDKKTQVTAGDATAGGHVQAAVSPVCCSAVVLQCCREAVGGEEIREMQNWHLLISDYRHLQLATLHSILCCAISYILPCLPSTMDQWLPPTIFVIADGSIQDCTINVVEVLSSHHLIWVRVLTQSSHHGPAHNTAPLHPRRL